MNNLIELKPVNTLSSFEKFCCTIGNLPSSYMLSLTFEEQILWFCDYLEKTVIPAINNNAEAVAELQILYVNLKNWVDNFFNDLDLQEQVNNKLNEMIETGVFDDIFINLLNTIKIYNTTNDMINDANNIKINQKIKTLGFYNINDGGGAYYYITNIFDDSIFQIPLSNNLFANLIVENNTINIRQLGGRSEQDTNFNHFDNKNIIQKYLNLQPYKKLKLYIPSGIWCCSELLINNTNGFNIYGDKFFNYRLNKNGTVITALNNNQRYIWKVGGNADFSQPTQEQLVSNFTIENIYFQSVKYNAETSIDEYFHVDYALTLEFAQMGILDNLNFGLINGGTLQMLSCWEINSNTMIFRNIGDFNTPKLYFNTPYTTIGNIGCNLTAINLNTIYFEGINGLYLLIDEKANMNNCRIGYINIEESFTTYGNNGFIIEKDESPSNKLSMFQIENAEIIIESISVQNFGRNSFQVGENIYTYTSIFSTKTNAFQTVTISNLHLYTFSNPMYIFEANNNNYRNRFIINNFYSYAENQKLTVPTNINNYMYFDILNFSAHTPQNTINIDYVNKERIYCYKNVIRIQNTLPKYIKTNENASNPLKLIVTSQKSTANYKPLLNIVKTKENDLILVAKGDEGISYTVGLSGLHNGVSTYYPFTLDGTGNFEKYSFAELNEAYFKNIDFDSNITVTDNTDYSTITGNSLEFDYFIFK